jgi:phosphatidylserine decarboxylase
MCETVTKKRFFIVLVSALNVGVMKVNFEPKIQTNALAVKPQAYEFKDLYLDKGEDFGCFEMGSTIVMLSQKGLIEYELQVGLHVRYAQKIAKINS